MSLKNFYFIELKTLIYLLIFNNKIIVSEAHLVEMLDFLVGYESYLAKNEYRFQLGPTNRPENIVIRYVSFAKSMF
jgi:hypothetical protein